MAAVLDSIDFGGWAFLVHLAALTQVIGYLIRDQLLLRIMLFVGTLFYIAYYRLFPAEPLWEAIIWGALLGLANLVMIVQIIHDRTRFQLPHDHARLFQLFTNFRPGDFRRLMKIAHFRKADRETVLTREGETPDQLFYVVDGRISITKGGTQIQYPAPTFIGELSMVTQGPASATVTLSPGSTYVVWNRDRLERMNRRKPSVKLALDMLLARDMALKIQNT